MTVESLEKSSTEVSEAAEITIESLQELSFELIDESVQTWRRFKDSGHGAARKLSYAAKIHAMIIDAMRLHPDIQDLKEMTDKLEEIDREYQLWEKREKITSDELFAFVEKLPTEVRNTFVEAWKREPIPRDTHSDTHKLT